MHRGNCSFTTKANVAEDAGASAILIINNQTGSIAFPKYYLYCFPCPSMNWLILDGPGETAISQPTVMIFFFELQAVLFPYYQISVIESGVDLERHHSVPYGKTKIIR